MGWSKFATIPSGKGFSINPFTRSLSVNDERIRDLFMGNAFSLITYYKIQTGKSKQIEITRPDGKYRVIIGLYSAANNPASISIESGITITEAGVVPEPAPSNRNSDPKVYREPWLQIKEDSDWTGGTQVIKARLDPEMGSAPDDFADRASVANISGGASIGVHLKNEGLSECVVNLFISWFEHLN